VSLPVEPSPNKILGEGIMAYRCDVCGKGSQKGHNISHAHNVTNRRFKPNLHKAKVKIEGSIKTLKVCTRCLRSNRVEKVV
jgi:large subunit ribosomal protein L28